MSTFARHGGSLAPSHMRRREKLELEGTGARMNLALGHHPIWIILGHLTVGICITQSAAGLGRISAAGSKIWGGQCETQSNKNV